MNADLTVRPLAAHDRSTWEELWALYLDFYGETVTPEATEATWRRVLRGEDGMGAIVALVDGEVVGLAQHVVHPTTWDVRDVCYLEDLIVHPDHRGKGVGRALIDALSRRARELGCVSVYWITAEDNATARRLYDGVARLSPFVRYEIEL